MIEGKVNSRDLAGKTTKAQNKIREGESELGAVRKVVDENMDVLVHEASMDHLAKLKQEMLKAVDADDNAGVQRILGDIEAHKKSIKDLYAQHMRENVGSYIDSSTGGLDMEKFEKELNAFMAETFVIWYGKKDADKAKISMLATPLAQMDYEKLRTVDTAKFGEYTINPETAGMNHKEKQPKIKIVDMKEFVGRPRSEVAKAVIEKYGAQYHIPGLEYEKYLLENPDKVPAELKDGNFYYFMGSTLRDQYGRTFVPYVRWHGSELRRIAFWLGY